MTNQTCNGYTNYSTWLIALYSDNEFDLYKEKEAWLDRFCDDEITTDDARAFALTSGLLPRVINSESEFEASNVDWENVSEAFTVELEEYRKYN